MTGAVVVFALLLAILVPLVLYALIEAETSSTTITDREDAQREAREFGGVDRGRESRSTRDARSESDPDETSTWGTHRSDDDEWR